MKRKIKKIISKNVIGDIVEKHTTKAPFNLVVENLTEAIKEHDFTIIATHDLKDTYQSKNLDVDFQYKIIHICNAEKSHKALANMSHDLGIMMPKSIVVAEQNGITTLRFMKMKPWMVSLMFPEIDIAPMSKMVTQIMRDIVLTTIKKSQEQDKSHTNPN